MKKSILLFAILFIAGCSCENTKKSSLGTDETININTDKPTQINKYKSLYTMTATTKGKIENTTKSITIITSQYFETNLGLTAEIPAKYQASNEIVKPTSVDNFYAVSQYVSDKSGTPLYFNSPMDFLNFMSERGYELFEQTKTKYSTNYTFKRKKP